MLVSIRSMYVQLGNDGDEAGRDQTHADVCGHKLSNVEWFDKGGHAIEKNQDDQTHEAIAGLQPLPMGFVRIQGVITVVTRSLGLRVVAVELGILEPGGC